LALCKRTGTIVEYQDRFQALLPRASRLDEEQRVQLFTGGLQPPLNLDVEVHNPQTLKGAMSLARKLELREQYAALAPRAANRGAAACSSTTPRPPCAAPANQAAPNTITIEGHPVKRLTQAEQKERRRLGLCYNCDEKFVRGHNRVCKRLFLLDGVLEEDDPDVFSEPHGLPLPHSRDHSITLTLGVHPVAVRPYRYQRRTRMSWNVSAPT
jgi:hypothetical protein